MRAVRVSARVVNRLVVVHKVPSVGVIDIAISVIVDAIIGCLVGINPDVVHQIGVSDLDAFIDDSHDHARFANDIVVPCFLSLTAERVGRSGWSDRRWCVVPVHPPKGTIGVVRVVAYESGLVNVIGFCVRHERVVRESRDRLRYGHAVTERHSFHLAEASSLHGLGKDLFRDGTVRRCAGDTALGRVCAG